MTNQLEIYKCAVCGNIVQVTNSGNGQLTCCNESMILLDGKTTDGATEKHLPCVEIQNEKGVIKVGEILHPMEDKHYITWIEIITPSKKVIRKTLVPGDEPSMTFCIKEKGEYIAREYCNLHGLWKTSFSI